MSCETVRRRLGAWMDGALGPDARAAVEVHLAACPACRGELARWEEAARALRASGPTPLPPGLADRAWRAAVAPRPRPVDAGFLVAARRIVLAGAVAAAAAWLLVIAGGGARQPQGAATAAQDPIEVAVLLWTTDGGAHGD